MNLCNTISQPLALSIALSCRAILRKRPDSSNFPRLSGTFNPMPNPRTKTVRRARELNFLCRSGTMTKREVESHPYAVIVVRLGVPEAVGDLLRTAPAS